MKTKARTYTKTDRLKHVSQVGKSGKMEMGCLFFRVNIVDERFRYGRYDVKVRPEGGEGERWVEFHNVILDD